MNDLFGIGLHKGAGRSNGGIPPAAHEGQRTLFRANLPAGDGGIDNHDARSLGLNRKLPGDSRRHCGVVNENAARLHRAKRAVATQRDRRQIFIRADAADDGINAVSSLCRGRCDRAAMLGNPVFRLSASAVIDDHLVAGLGQMPGHGAAHNAKSDECDFCHICSLGTDAPGRQSPLRLDLPHLAISISAADRLSAAHYGRPEHPSRHSRRCARRA